MTVLAAKRGTSMRRISNSEASTWLSCRKMYYYRYALNLKPKVVGQPLQKGNLFHSAVEAFYKGLQENKSLADSTLAGEQYFTDQVTKNSEYDLELIGEARRLYSEYVAHYGAKDQAEWKILGVEVTLDLPLNDEYSMPLTFDLLIQERATKQIGLVDHKTTYDFWPDIAHQLNPQFPKYLGALRANDKPVNFCMLNEVRTRRITNPDPAMKWKRTPYRLSNAKVKNAIYEQIIVSEEISRFRELPVEVQEKVSLRCLNKQICKYCDVSSLCASQFDGGDISYLMQVDYEPQTSYGYNPENMLGEM